MLLPKNLSLEELTQRCREGPGKVLDCLNIYPQETKIDVTEFLSICKFKFSTISRIWTRSIQRKSYIITYLNWDCEILHTQK